MMILHAVSGPVAGTTYELGGSTTIGRDGESDIQLIEEGVSRRHACVTQHDDGSMVVYDLGSRNGTLMGGERVGNARLTHGDRFEIGDTVFELREGADGSFATDSLDMKLISGPAVKSTVMDDATALRDAALAAQYALMAAQPPCCDSPLATQAFENGWPHCPACGASVG